MEIQKIGFTELTDKSVKDSVYFYKYAIEEIDKIYGKGYSKQYPNLVSEFVNTIIAQNNSHYQLLAINEIKISIDDLRDMVKHISESL